MLFVLSSCTSSQYASVSKEDTIEIFYKEHTPNDLKYEILGVIETSNSIFTSNDKLLDALQKKAEDIGANAIIDVEFGYIPHITTGIPYVKGIAIKWE